MLNRRETDSNSLLQYSSRSYSTRATITPDYPLSPSTITATPPYQHKLRYSRRPFIWAAASSAYPIYKTPFRSINSCIYSVSSPLNVKHHEYSSVAISFSHTILPPWTTQSFSPKQHVSKCHLQPAITAKRNLTAL